MVRILITKFTLDFLFDVVGDRREPLFVYREASELASHFACFSRLVIELWNQGQDNWLIMGGRGGTLAGHTNVPTMHFV